jgi:hypothetical protein
MSFKKNKYQILKNAISFELADFFFNYLLLKKRATKYLYDNNFIEENDFFGSFQDPYVPNAFSIYADQVMETLLIKMIPVVKEKTGLDLIPTYSYLRVYEKNSILLRHKDRQSCEISTTLNLGGDPWPIYLSPNENVGIPNDKDITTESKAKGIKFNLKPGDMLVYRGMELEHWREQFKGKLCVQVFLHYNDKNGPFAENNLYDKRACLGLPSYVKKIKNDIK